MKTVMPCDVSPGPEEGARGIGVVWGQRVGWSVKASERRWCLSRVLRDE